MNQISKKLFFCSFVRHNKKFSAEDIIPILLISKYPNLITFNGLAKNNKIKIGEKNIKRKK